MGSTHSVVHCLLTSMQAGRTRLHGSSGLLCVGHAHMAACVQRDTSGEGVHGYKVWPVALTEAVIASCGHTTLCMYCPTCNALKGGHHLYLSGCGKPKKRNAACNRLRHCLLTANLLMGRMPAALRLPLLQELHHTGRLRLQSQPSELPLRESVLACNIMLRPAKQATRACSLDPSVAVQIVPCISSC